MSSAKNTNINWITVHTRKEDEWCGLKKVFSLEKEIKSAVIRFESDCVCAVYVNGEFIISGTGRTPERVNCHEVTSRLRQGENTLELVLGGHYFQKFGLETRAQRGYWLNQAALELQIDFADGSRMNVPTDDSWVKTDPEEKAPVLQTMQVTSAEYETMWKNAALWRETTSCEQAIPKEVLQVVGDEYEKYAAQKAEEVLPCRKIVSSDMQYADGVFTPGSGADECSLIFDMGRTVVGFAEFKYEASGDITVDSMFDVTEQPEDFGLEGEWAGTVIRLSTKDQLKAGKHLYRNLRRRAFRYLKLTFKGNLEGFTMKFPGVRQCLFPEAAKGWFRCSDELLNTAWEVGRYTFHISKQQEYESCPRCEMLFFAGDGAIDAQIDLYTFGDCDMLNTSLSLKHQISAAGISNTDKFNRTVWQWDYFAWRIICIYNYYRHTGDKEFLKRHYAEAVTNISWLTERMNDKDLLFQIPAFRSTFSSQLIQVDWACSTHRLGENAFLNCLLYKALVCISELATDLQDQERGREWARLAERVKKAVNTYLWDEKKGAYLDSFADYICQDSNVFAVLFGVADEERALTALTAVKEKLWSSYGSAMAEVKLADNMLRGGNASISPTMSAHEAEAWFRQDKPEEGLDLIRRVWGTMLRKGATTFWEFTPNDADGKWEYTKCHAWSAGCTYLLSAFVLGIRPDAPNWEKIIFAPRPCDLESGKGVVPTPKGFIAASWEKETDHVYRFTVALPKDIDISVSLPENGMIQIVKY